MFKITDKISKLPKTPGVYAFKDKKAVLYIGKAKNIKERVKNHFQQPNYKDDFFINQIKKFGFIETDSEIEALILEANLIKRYKPKYNIVWRDDKNYFYAAITKDKIPQIFITHQFIPATRNQLPITQYIGPFVDGSALKQTVKTLQLIFPYKTSESNIKSLIKILKGGKIQVINDLKKEMKTASFKQDYEKAARIRNKINSLEKVLANAKIIKQQEEPGKILQKILKADKPVLHIEAYDISDIQGQTATGSMVTFINGLPEKNFYRKFKVKISGKPNDVAMLKEVINRRLKHAEWPYPDLILIDGGKGQLSAAKNSQKIKLAAIAKKNNELFIEGRPKPILLKSLPRSVFNLILQLRDEAHRFARKYHHKLRKIDLLAKP